jgi:uncharacterized protein (TIGR00725 family)
MRVAVIGGSTVTDEQYRQARRVGELLGDRGHEVVCGGFGGVMEAVCAGARETGAHTIGILPNEDRTTANEYVETAIVTGMGNARNVLVVLNGDAVIAVDGSSGTLSELGHALDMERPIAGIGTHSLEGIKHVDTAEDAVEYVESAVQ